MVKLKMYVNKIETILPPREKPAGFDELGPERAIFLIPTNSWATSFVKTTIAEYDSVVGQSRHGVVQV